MGNAQSANCLPVKNQSQDREEINKKREPLKEKTTLSPGKEKILIGNWKRRGSRSGEVECSEEVEGAQDLDLPPGLAAMPRANLKKYLPSGYASGYGSGNFF
ncbi:hypothetical protein T06_16018 [Trichinella sp. T6]|nr:hypothetical protein T06_16018 [Trichinella sp. T6]